MLGKKKNTSTTMHISYSPVIASLSKLEPPKKLLVVFKR
jgi:hypothetical protein